MRTTMQSTMRSTMRSGVVMAAVLAAACSRAPKEIAEPQLAGGESPAAFQRAIGLTLLRTGQPRRALPYLERLARLEPTKAEPRYYLGRAFLDMRMWDLARSSISHALVLAPTFAPAHALLGVFFDSRGDHARAAVAYRRAMQLDPLNPGYRNNLGFSQYLAGNYVDAASTYSEALKLGPNLQRVHNNLGFTYGKLRKLDEASEHFRLGGTPGEAANNLGVVYEDRGDVENAYRAYADAVRLAPDLEPARDNLERVAAQLHRPLPANLEGRQ